MRRFRAELLAVALLALSLVLCLAGSAWGASVAELAKKLASHDDFRVRTQAALALGASGSAKAVKPLCAGLGDDSDSVRAAAAAGLGRLQLGGADCLKKRFKKEKTRNVKRMIKKAIRLLKDAASGPAVSGNTKFYLVIGKTTDETKRGGSQIDNLVQPALRRAASSVVPGSIVAPKNAGEDQANKMLRKHRQVEAFFLEPVVPEIEYFEGKLTVRLNLLIYSYPNRSLQGNVNRKVEMTGVGDKSVAKENQLIEALCKAAMEHFAQLLAQSD